jgi:hypothetical protein
MAMTLAQLLQDGAHTMHGSCEVLRAHAYPDHVCLLTHPSHAAVRRVCLKAACLTCD